MIIITCTCGKRFQTQDEHAGKRTKCPACGDILVVPTLVAEVGSTGKADKPAPPSWWYPQGQPEVPGDPARPVPPTGGTRTRITPPSTDSASKAAGVPQAPEKKSRRLVIASGVGGVSLLLLGLLLWMGNSGPGREQAPGGGPISGDRGSSARVANPEAGGTPVDPMPPGDTSATPLGVGKPKSDSETAPPPPAPVAGQPRLKLLVPAYFYPADQGLKQWEQLIEAASRVPVVAIANPASGPGDARNPDYAKIIRRATLGRVTVIGYVGTNYAHRPLPEVEADIDRWIKLYPEIGGIFLDAQASEAGQAGYYVTLRDHARGKIKGATVISNPGTVCAEEYASRLGSVALCLFTNPVGFEEFRLPRWAGRHSSERFAAMPNNVAGPDLMRDFIQVAPLRGFGLIYVTDSPPPNLWDRLPAYWGEEVEAVRKVNAGQSP